MVRLFSVGTAAALVFPKVFFNDLPPELATLASMASFAVAFVLRPLEGMVIGHFGDQMGHKKILVFTLLFYGALHSRRRVSAFLQCSGSMEPRASDSPVIQGFARVANGVAQH